VRAGCAIPLLQSCYSTYRHRRIAFSRLNTGDCGTNDAKRCCLPATYSCRHRLLYHRGALRGARGERSAFSSPDPAAHAVSMNSCEHAAKLLARRQNAAPGSPIFCGKGADTNGTGDFTASTCSAFAWRGERRSHATYNHHWTLFSLPSAGVAKGVARSTYEKLSSPAPA